MKMNSSSRTSLVAFLLLAGAGSSAAVAAPAMDEALQQLRVICLLEVDGERYIDGECTMTRLRPVGSETLGSLQLEDQNYYVQMNYTAPNEAYLHWSGTTGVKWTRSDLGRLKSNGLTCFLSDTVKACLWPIPKLGKGSSVTDVRCFAQGKLCKEKTRP
jgi:hypothetical protein